MPNSNSVFSQNIPLWNMPNGQQLRYATKSAVNVREHPYNALGDGTTDDLAAINAAVAATQTGETLYFPRGVYRHTGTIVITKAMSIVMDIGACLFPDVGTSADGLWLKPPSGDTVQPFRLYVLVLGKGNVRHAVRLSNVHRSHGHIQAMGGTRATGNEVYLEGILENTLKITSSVNIQYPQVPTGFNGVTLDSLVYVAAPLSSIPANRNTFDLNLATNTAGANPMIDVTAQEIGVVTGGDNTYLGVIEASGNASRYGLRIANCDQVSLRDLHLEGNFGLSVSGGWNVTIGPGVYVAGQADINCAGTCNIDGVDIDTLNVQGGVCVIEPSSTIRVIQRPDPTAIVIKDGPIFNPYTDPASNRAAVQVSGGSTGYQTVHNQLINGDFRVPSDGGSDSPFGFQQDAAIYTVTGKDPLSGSTVGGDAQKGHFSPLALKIAGTSTQKLYWGSSNGTVYTGTPSTTPPAAQPIQPVVLNKTWVTVGCSVYVPTGTKPASGFTLDVVDPTNVTTVKSVNTAGDGMSTVVDQWQRLTLTFYADSATYNSYVVRAYNASSGTVYISDLFIVPGFSAPYGYCPPPTVMADTLFVGSRRIMFRDAVPSLAADGYFYKGDVIFLIAGATAGATGYQCTTAGLGNVAVFTRIGT